MLKKHLINSTYSLAEIKRIFRKLGVTEKHAEQLICSALNISREEYYISDGKIEVSGIEQLELLNNYLNNIIKGIPLQYVLGYADFWKFRFKITQDTLIPRPETELIIEQSLKHFSNTQSARILDLGTGCGILAICLQHEFPNAQVIACDISVKALEIARLNAKQILGHKHNIRLIESNWYSALEKGVKFQLIVSNPPYISSNEYVELDSHVKNYEPKVALTDNENGLAHYMDIIQGAKHHLAANGILILEHGYTQKTKLNKLLIENGFEIVDNVVDLAQLDRILIAKLYENH